MNANFSGDYQVVGKGYEAPLWNAWDKQIVCDITTDIPPMGKTKRLKKLFLFPEYRSRGGKPVRGFREKIRFDEVIRNSAYNSDTH